MTHIKKNWIYSYKKIMNIQFYIKNIKYFVYILYIFIYTGINEWSSIPKLLIIDKDI